MTILLDTNILINYIFNHEPIKELFELSKARKITIYISEMVLWECEKHFIEKINSEIGRYNKALANLSKLISNKNKKFVYDNDKGTIKDFFNNIKDKLIKNYQIEIANFDHKNIIDSMKNRYLESKAPFHNKGDNFKDYIIWESYREIINKNKNEEYIFISDNVKDFSDNGKGKQSDNKTNKKDYKGEYSIHKDFREDIQNINLNSYTDIDSFKHENENYKNIYKEYFTEYLFKKFESDRTNISVFKELFKFMSNTLQIDNTNNDYSIEILDNSKIVDKGGNSIEVDIKVTPADTSHDSEKKEIKTKCIFTIDTQKLKLNLNIDITSLISELTKK